MKVVHLVLLVAVGTASASPLSANLEIEVLRNALDELVRRALEYVRWLLQRHEPYSFPPLPEQHVTDTDIDLKFSTINVKLSKAEDFTIDKIKNDLVHLQSSFGITVPQAHLEGDYEISGTALGKIIRGSGTFGVDIEDFKQTGDIQLTIIDHSIQIQDLKLDYDLSGAKFSIDGLDVEGVETSDIEAFLNDELVAFLKENKALVVAKVSEHAKQEINKRLRGHTLQDVLDWIKQIVASTPDPPPFPF